MTRPVHKIIDVTSKVKKFESLDNYNLWKLKPSYWMEFGSKPKTLKQELILCLFGDFIKKQNLKFAGFEYWSDFLSSQSFENINYGSPLPMHKDKDEALFHEKKKLKSPMLGCVFYPIVDKLVGGDLQIFDGPDCKKNKIIKQIKPEKNRLIIFESGKFWHRVDFIKSGYRAHFAVNLWKNKPYGLNKPHGINFEPDVEYEISRK